MAILLNLLVKKNDWFSVFTEPEGYGPFSQKGTNNGKDILKN